MHFGEIKIADVANGPGMRVTLFVSGCTNRCKGCFQPQTWDFCYGKEWTKEWEDVVMEALAKPYCQGLTVLGGEPFEPENQRELVKLLRRVKQALPTKNIWAFTGFVSDRDLISGGRKHCEVTDDMLSMIDILVDGPFVEEKKNLSLRFRGSENQRIIDMNKTREAGEIVIWDGANSR
jgi:anaerobic ribonucleoside-triphosphate reductase activating protein